MKIFGFFWKGKPCIMAYPDNLTNSDTDRQIAYFFTFRPGQPDYVNGPSRDDHWGWLENYPQHGYVKNENGGFEEVAVGVAQNASPETNGHCSAFNLPGSFGRDFSQKKGFDPRIDGYLYGILRNNGPGPLNSIRSWCLSPVGMNLLLVNGCQSMAG
jgi:hypothetical protein